MKAPMVSTRLEIELVLCCARTHMDAEHVMQLRGLLREDLDWAYLLQTALQHGVMPLLYGNLNTTCPEAVPKVTLDQLRDHFCDNIGHNLFLTDELLNILNLLEAHDIPALPYKGPVLAVPVYGNLALRQFSDLDILVHERDFARATSLLLAQSFRQNRTFEWESSFVHNQRMFMVDLHRGLTPQQFGFSLDFERLWQHRTSVCLAGTTVPTLAPEDLLIVLCVQVAKDAWGDLYRAPKSRYGRLLKICDIAEVLRVYQHIDWERVLTDARRLGGQRMLLLGLRLASELLDMALPENILQRMQAHPSVGALAVHVRAQLFPETDDSSITPLTRTRFHFVIRERTRDKIFPYLHVGTSLLMPTEKDRALLPLPAPLSPLYYLFRPIRLIAKYALKLSKMLRQLRRRHRTRLSGGFQH